MACLLMTWGKILHRSGAAVAFVRCNHGQVRFASSKCNAPRLRFAPSPTGLLHLGGLRTALYNYLMCRNTGGTFVLRIEDTDRARTLPGALENIIQSLEWMGIAADEGPHCGGPFAPYIQSERAQLYRDYAETLIKNDAAYRCFCSPVRLEIVRKEALKSGTVSGYDNKCRSLSHEEVAERMAQGVPSAVRLKMDQRRYEFHDEIHGLVSTEAGREGDPVILKSDGFPTYHLANVVDDHAMEITHVLRGIEWQISTPKHLQLYSALGWQPPKFAHLPLLLNPDGSKLSKRQGALDIIEYKRLGYYPEALLTMLAQVGGGFRSQVAQSMDTVTKDDLIRDFDLSKITKSSCKVALEKLPVFNKHIVAQMVSEPPKLDIFIADVKDLLLKKYGLTPTDETIKRVIQWAGSRLSSVNDLASDDLEFVWIRKAPAQPFTEEQLRLLDNVKVLFTDLPNGSARMPFSQLLQHHAKENGLDPKGVMHALRLALTGLAKGPSIVEITDILGSVECLDRIQRIVERQSKSGGSHFQRQEANKVLNK
ncbi:probable glutamate--tRNA ligase, mitochondrial [Paramacrobiotus metropolitanus]|uniref:probable glutamate--tRNA ligase, mitochondrial n=1 Tax=Paramacrobiotus metropolitanus TaxID=2943436 RepID=UPI002445B9C6|nr:probable glutamate--tRNA ligase, mitochondrial [Paramacrobiotus metropolitanus]